MHRIPPGRHAVEPPAPRPPSRAHRLLRELAPLLLVLLLLGVTRTSFANHYVVPSGSMMPTLQPGDRVVADMRAYGLRVPFTDIVVAGEAAPRAGDVVLLKSPVDGTRLIKRVVALGGDRVTLRGGRLAINGKWLAREDDPTLERFGARGVRLDLGAGGGPWINGLVVPAGQALVLGDHRGNSADGRVFGLVEASSLYARAVAVYYRREGGIGWQRL